MNKADMIAAASLFTVEAIRRCIALNKLKVFELILAGGGAKNNFYKEHLMNKFKDATIKFASEYGYPEDYLEAISFAVLANETICSKRYDLRKVTGSKKPVVSGKICQA
jgi:anhydro-N-acetylmuramic acid kinase